MTGAFPPGFLEFFILEASDYVEQLDALLLGGGAAAGVSGANGVGGAPGLSGADAATMQRVARALRGTATMAKLIAYADLAASIERVGRALQDGTVRWDPALSGALVAAIDDLKSLLHSARTWSATEDQRAAARVAELARYAPAVPRGRAIRGESSTIQEPAAAFFGIEAANIAAGLELLTTRAGDPATAANVLGRVRALRGVAGVKEIARLAEVLEATEEATRGLEDPHGAGAHGATTELTAQARQLLEAAAAYLRTQSVALRTGAHVDAPSAARDVFEAALEAWSTTMAGAAADRERVVPISQLFFGDDTSGIVETSPNPPTSATERFRLELVSLGEHLRQVVAGARQASSGGAPGSVARASRDMHRALEALEAAARSFGEQQVAEFIAAHAQAADRLDYLSLASLEDLAAVVSEPGDASERLRARVSDVTGGRDLSTAIATGFGHGEPVESAPPLMSQLQRVSSERPAPVSSERPTPVTSERPTPAALFTPPAGAPPPPAPPPAAPPPVPTPAMPAAALLDSTIAALESIPEHVFARPTPIPEDALVPIESLLYHGRSALDRAVEIRDDLRRRGAAASPDAAALEELFDLLELARTE